MLFISVNERIDMGKLKRSLPEDIDLTDERDLSCTLDDDLPDTVDNCIYNLASSVDQLEELGAIHLINYADEIKSNTIDLIALNDHVQEIAKRSF